MDTSTVRTLDVEVRSAPLFRNGWIFSPGIDLLIFGAPLLLGLQLIWLDETVGLDGLLIGRWSLYTFAFALMTFADGGHQLSTIFRSYLDPEVRQQQKQLLRWGPFVVMAFTLTVELVFGAAYVIYLFAYFQTYHLMRQQYGWASMASAKAGEMLSAADRILDKIVIYGLLLFPLAWAHVARPLNPRRIPMTSSPDLARLFIAGFITCVCLYLGRVILKRIQGHPINGSKLFIVMATALAWGGVLFIDSRVWPFAAVMHHAIPYAGIVFVTTRARPACGGGIPKRLWKHKYAVLAFGFGVFLAGYTWSKVLGFLGGLPVQEHAGVSLMWLGAAMPLMHFIIDGVIWRRKA
jgi:hypothetical protein